MLRSLHALSHAALLAASVPIGIALFLRTPWLPSTPPNDRTLSPTIRPAGSGHVALLDRIAHPSDPAPIPDASEGAVPITDKLIADGRRAFYEETFGNEVALTEVAGLLDGPITPWVIARAIAALGGDATTNLRIRIDRDARIGAVQFKAGTVIDTGLDVPKGSMTPLGLRTRIVSGRVQAGITCAACHSAVDPHSGLVVEGAPNNDLAIGTLIAFARNSAALFRQTGADPRTFPPNGAEYSDLSGQRRHLPEPIALEDAVDADLLAWPPGSFDSTADLVNNPTQIPTSFTFDAHPYGWNGFAAVGWFRGLSTISDHATGLDPTTGADSIQKLSGIDKDLYLGVIFQRASRSHYRLSDGANPSDHLARIDPTPGAPGLSMVAAMPGYPAGSRAAPDGLMASRSGRTFAYDLHAMSAFQNTLAPPPARHPDLDRLRNGASVFARAGCDRCHSGPSFTNNTVIPIGELQTQPSRARAHAALPATFREPGLIWPPNVTVPIPPGTTPLIVPVESAPSSALFLAFAQADEGGGYKVPSLIGLAWSAPYLHDGGAAASPDALRGDPRGSWMIASPVAVGLPGLLRPEARADPASSLRVLLDRGLRREVVAIHRVTPAARRANIDGSGHDFWVDDSSGFSTIEQDDLIAFLLSLDDDPAVRP